MLVGMTICSNRKSPNSLRPGNRIRASAKAMNAELSSTDAVTVSVTTLDTPNAPRNGRSSLSAVANRKAKLSNVKSPSNSPVL